MAIAEYRFYEQQNYKKLARGVREGPQAPEVAALRPGAVQDRLVLLEAGRHDEERAAVQGRPRPGQEEGGRAARQQQKRAEELQGEALDYLVEVFTEDDPKTARDAFEFLAQIGGKQYSRKVFQQLADTVFDQTRYERAIEAYRLLIKLDPNDGDAPDTQEAIVEALQLLGDIKTAVVEMRKLAETTARAAPGPRRTRIARRPSSTRARWPKS